MSSRPRRKTAKTPARPAAAQRRRARRTRTPRAAAPAVPLTTPTPMDAISPIVGAPPAIDGDVSPPEPAARRASRTAHRGR